MRLAPQELAAPLKFRPNNPNDHIRLYPIVYLGYTPYTAQGRILFQSTKIFPLHCSWNHQSKGFERRLDAEEEAVLDVAPPRLLHAAPPSGPPPPPAHQRDTEQVIEVSGFKSTALYPKHPFAARFP